MSGLSAPSIWSEFNANGALADVLVTDFGRTAMAGNATLIPPRDWILCLSAFEYGAAASVSVQIFFATAAGVAAELIKQYLNQTLQYYIGPSVEVPRDATGLPFTMRVTKAATNARIGFRYEWRLPGGC